MKKKQTLFFRVYRRLYYPVYDGIIKNYTKKNGSLLKQPGFNGKYPAGSFFVAQIFFYE